MSSRQETVLVMGASENPERYSNKAIKMLQEYHHHVVALGRKAGMVNETAFITEFPYHEQGHIDTVTLYLNPLNQQSYQQAIIELKPARVIFNPGTENPEFEELLASKGIEPVEACTLVLLRTGQF